MGPVALVFGLIPATLTVVDRGLKGFLTLRTIHRAKRAAKAKDESPEPAEAEDDLLPISFDLLMSRKDFEALQRTEAWKVMCRGAELAQNAKQVGSAPCCQSCGRFEMN